MYLLQGVIVFKSIINGETDMNTLLKNKGFSAASMLAVMLLMAGCVTPGPSSETVPVVLSGALEVPPVTTKAIGYGAVVVWPGSKAVAGSLTTFDMNVTAAHIHEGVPGENGAVVVPFTKVDGRWVIPANAHFTDAQYASYQAGNLYLNVHSPQYPNGEMRGQIKPFSAAQSR
jgi:CHRD domain